MSLGSLVQLLNALLEVSSGWVTIHLLNDAAWGQCMTGSLFQICLILRGGCRERSDGLYKVITYLTAKLLEELTVGLIGSLIFSCVVFFPSKFQGQWLLFWLTYWCTMSIGIGKEMDPADQ